MRFRFFFIFLIFLIFLFNFNLVSGECDYIENNLKKIGPSIDGFFGTSIGLSGNVAVVGSPGTNSINILNRGIENTWDTAAIITPGLAEENDYFGSSVSIDGSTVVIGSHGYDGFGIDSGAVYIYQTYTDVSVWSQTKKIEPSNGLEGDRFGSVVLLSGDTLFVTSLLSNFGGTDSGSVYIFERNEGGLNNWGLIQEIKSNDIAPGDKFGNSIAVYQDTLVIGAPYHNSNGGAVYVFERDNNVTLSNWVQTHKIVPLDNIGGDQFGFSVAIYDNALVVGNPFVDVDGEIDAGEVYLFEFANSIWTEVRKFQQSPKANDYFGYSVAVNSKLILVGEINADTTQPHTGVVHVFGRDDGIPWDYLTHTSLEEGEDFGSSVSIYEDVILVGAPARQDNSGTLYTFIVNYCDNSAIKDRLIVYGSLSLIVISSLAFAVFMIRSTKHSESKDNDIELSTVATTLKKETVPAISPEKDRGSRSSSPNKIRNKTPNKSRPTSPNKSRPKSPSKSRPKSPSKSRPKSPSKSKKKKKMNPSLSQRSLLE